MALQTSHLVGPADGPVELDPSQMSRLEQGMEPEFFAEDFEAHLRNEGANGSCQFLPRLDMPEAAG
jgi:hypothetical protein